jgi:cytochrome P450
MVVGGCPVHKGDPMMTYVRSANRDPEVFEEPNRFDITRKHVSHVAFGGGAHICIGAPLARMEALVAIPRLFDHFPGIRLADQTYEWRSLPGFRGLEQLIVETG